jgi:hypothetical protein
MINGRWVGENNLTISKEMACDKDGDYFIIYKKVGKEE